MTNKFLETKIKTILWQIQINLPVQDYRQVKEIKDPGHTHHTQTHIQARTTIHIFTKDDENGGNAY